MLSPQPQPQHHAYNTHEKVHWIEIMMRSLQILAFLSTIHISNSFIIHTNNIHGNVIRSNSKNRHVSIISRRISLFNNEGNVKIPKSTKERDNQAIQSIQKAISAPRNKNFPLIECEFPPLSSLNKLGDGSLRSTIEVEEVSDIYTLFASNVTLLKFSNRLTYPLQ